MKAARGRSTDLARITELDNSLAAVGLPVDED